MLWQVVSIFGHQKYTCARENGFQQVSLRELRCVSQLNTRDCLAGQLRLDVVHEERAPAQDASGRTARIL